MTTMKRSDGIKVLTPNEIEVIRERHFGWEKAPPKLLADVFRVSVQMIAAVLRRKP